MPTIDVKRVVTEALGTAMLVFFGVGVATLSFGFGFTGGSTSAGVVATAFAFGLVLLALAYALGPISGCHINPAVTLAFLVGRRIALRDAVGYWVAQVVGGIVGARVLYGVVHSSAAYRTSMGLGANGFGGKSMVGLDAFGAVLVEVVLTMLFVFVVLTVTRDGSPPLLGGAAIGLALTVVHLIGIPLTGTSVNPARSIAPAVFVGGAALTQLWVFILAPLAGAAAAAGLHRYLFPPTEPEAEPEAIPAPADSVPAQRKAPATRRRSGSPAPGA
jgi:aquaporin Z